MMTVLRTENITMKFGGITAVSNFSMELNENKIIGLIGPNGAGKTTAFNIITGVYPPTEGSIFYGDKNITRAKPHNNITKLGIARTFQNIRLFKELSVLENVLIANHLRLRSNPFAAVVRTPNYLKQEKHMLEKSLALLEEVDLLDVKDEKSFSLPYGKQRRLEIARALATNPRVLLLDEPAAGMNPQESNQLMEFIQRIRENLIFLSFMIEHHMQVVMGICEKNLCARPWDYHCAGNPYEIQNNPKVIEAYLGVE